MARGSPAVPAGRPAAAGRAERPPSGSSHVAPFAGADPIALLDRNHEHAAIADLPGPRRLDDGRDRVVDQAVGYDDLDFHLGQQADVVLLAAIDRGVAFLLAVAADLGHGHPRQADASQGLLHVVDFVGPHDRLDQLHLTPPAFGESPRSTRRSPRRSVWLRPW